MILAERHGATPADSEREEGWEACGCVCTDLERALAESRTVDEDADGGLPQNSRALRWRLPLMHNMPKSRRLRTPAHPGGL